MSKQHPMLLVSLSIILTVLSTIASIIIALLPHFTNGRASRAEVLPAQIGSGICLMFSILLLIGAVTLATSRRDTDGHI